MTLTADEAKERLEGVLKAAGIDADFYIVDVGAIVFPDGARFYGGDFYLFADGYTNP